MQLPFVTRLNQGVSLNTPAADLELFPELAVAASEKPARAKRAAKPQTAQRVAMDSASPSLAPNALTGAEGTPEDVWETMARKLESHVDYRVQRRLKPQLVWPGTSNEKTVRVLVLDTETTGLDASKDRIIELALLRVEMDGQTGLPVGEVQVYDGLEDPGRPIPPEVVALTGLRDADVQGQRLDEARVNQMLEGVDLIIAHNAGFDRPFVESRLSQFASLSWACSFADIDWKAQGRSSSKLENLAQANGWFYDAHRAEMDCHALLAVLAQRLPHADHTGLSHLLQASKRPTYALQATNAPFEAKDKLKSRGYRWNAEQRVWHTRIKDEVLLRAECEWLKENVYGSRRAVVQIEKLDALVRFSARAGALTQQQL